MSRGWIIGIVCLTLSASSSLTCRAQESNPSKSEGLSFTERLTALRETFRRQTPPSDLPLTAQAQQNKKLRAKTQSTASRYSSNQNKSKATASRSVPGTRYRRYTAASTVPAEQIDEPAPQVASESRAGSVSGRKPSRQASRYPSRGQEANRSETASPVVRSAKNTKKAKRTRTIQASAAEESDEAIVESKPRAKKKTTSRKAARPVRTGQPGAFDVHEALVGESEEKRQKPVRQSQPAIAEGREERQPPRLISSNDAKQSEAEQTVVQPTDKQPESQNVVEEVVVPEVEQQKSVPVQKTPAIERKQSVERKQSESRYQETENQSEVSSPVDPFGEESSEKVSANPMRNSSPSKAFASANPVTPMRQYQQAQGELLLSSQQPVIVSHVKGPRSILVGQEAIYQVTLENTSERNAETIAAAIRIPEWAEIIDVTSTNGAVERRGEGNNGDVLEWQLHEIAAKSSATLRLRLIPRSGRPMQLGVQWSQAAVASETMVEVQEPKLEVGLSGPQEVLFGQPQRYRLILRNPGTGAAKQVVVQLIPPGGDEQSATTQTIGALQAGEVKEIELELTAREAGELIMQASAVAEGGLTAEAVKKVLCRRPELQVDWRGPETKYAGTISAYYIRVKNPGTAMTEPVTVTFDLPEGSQFISASDGHTFDKASRTVSWRLAGLGVDEDQFMQIRCQIDQPGINRFNVTAQSDNEELSDSKTIETNIVALADLKLDVTDPQGPLPLGDSALYEIRIRNRGRTAAKGINIVGLFSAGIDPVSVEGAQYTERDGRVIFHPIKTLPAGREIVLRIRAEASQEGTHIFRAEVNCEDLEIKLAAEETTRFFKDEFRWEDGQTPYSAENDETVSR